MNLENLKQDAQRRMDGAISNLTTELDSLRTGRASPKLLDSVMVQAYGNQVDLSQVGTISVPDSRLLSLQIWDKTMVKPVEKAILDSGLGLNPQSDGTLIRIPIPPLNQERRQEMAKIAGRYAEQSRVSIRHVRRDVLDKLKKLEKSGELSQDDYRIEEKNIQKITDESIHSIDTLFSEKESEIMKV